MFWKLVLVLPDCGEEQSPGNPGRLGRGSLWGFDAEKAAGEVAGMSEWCVSLMHSRFTFWCLDLQSVLLDLKLTL